mgnify:CR=1 FL=1
MLDGGGGADYLDGGLGDDVMTGGKGADSFVFHDGSDLVTDFKANQGDEVFLSELLFDPNAISA